MKAIDHPNPTIGIRNETMQEKINTIPEIIRINATETINDTTKDLYFPSL